MPDTTAPSPAPARRPLASDFDPRLRELRDKLDTLISDVETALDAYPDADGDDPQVEELDAVLDHAQDARSLIDEVL